MDIIKYSELTQEERANFLDNEDIVVEIDVVNLSVEELSGVINYVGNLLAEKEQRIMELELTLSAKKEVERGCELLEKHIKVLEDRLKQVSYPNIIPETHLYAK